METVVCITLHNPTTIRVAPTDKRLGAKLKEIPFAKYDGDEAWRLPLNALQSAIRAVGVKNVSLDYDVLKARDKQLQRVVAQYRACGVRIWNDGGKVATDNAPLTKALQPLAPLLLHWLPTEPGPKKAPGIVPRAVVEAEGDAELQMWLWGNDEATQNAQSAEYRQAALHKPSSRRKARSGDAQGQRANAQRGRAGSGYGVAGGIAGRGGQEERA